MNEFTMQRLKHRFAYDDKRFQVFNKNISFIFVQTLDRTINRNYIIYKKTRTLENFAKENIMLRTHKSTTNDTRGTEFEYTCYTQQDRVYAEDTDGKYRFHDSIERDYVVYDGKGTGKSNVLASAKTLKELKEKMGNI